MNPKMIRPIVQALTVLAKIGVQIFVTTHDYFVQQEFLFVAVFLANRSFISLTKQNAMNIINVI